jgi:hypothetical protein
MAATVATAATMKKSGMSAPHSLEPWMGGVAPAAAAGASAIRLSRK